MTDGSRCRGSFPSGGSRRQWRHHRSGRHRTVWSSNRLQQGRTTLRRSASTVLCLTIVGRIITLQHMYIRGFRTEPMDSQTNYLLAQGKDSSWRFQGLLLPGVLQGTMGCQYDVSNGTRTVFFELPLYPASSMSSSQPQFLSASLQRSLHGPSVREQRNQQPLPAMSMSALLATNGVHHLESCLAKSTSIGGSVGMRFYPYNLLWRSTVVTVLLITHTNSFKKNLICWNVF